MLQIDEDFRKHIQYRVDSYEPQLSIKNEIDYMNAEVEEWIRLVIVGMELMLYAGGQGIKRIMLFNAPRIIDQESYEHWTNELQNYKDLLDILAKQLAELNDIRDIPVPQRENATKLTERDKILLKYSMSLFLPKPPVPSQQG